MLKRKLFIYFGLCSVICAIVMAISVTNSAAAANPQKSYAYKIEDVTRAQRILADMEEADAALQNIYDVNHNGKLDVGDVTDMQRHVAEYIDINSVEYQSQFDAATYLTLPYTKLELGINEVVPLEYDTDSTMLSFNSKNTDIAVVDDNGIITPKATGSTTVVCSTANGIQAECEVVIASEAKTVSLNAASLKLGVGEGYTLKSSLPNNTAAYYQEFTSSNPNVADIEPSGGLVVAKSVGQATVTCTLSNGAKAECSINILPPAKTVTLNVSALTLSVGETFDVDSYVPSGTASYHRSYYSGNTTVAAVKKSGGIITAKAIGSTTILCQTGTGANATIALTVTQAPTAISLNTYDSKEVIGKNYYLYASTKQGGDKNRIYQYSTSNPKVVLISKYSNNASTLTPMSQGTAYITVKTYNNVSAVCKVTVSGTTVKCIDISTWQGSNVDFNKVKKAGINYVIIRAGYGQTKDNQFENNYYKAKAAGMKVGVYWFSYSTTVSGGITEANACIKHLNGKKLDLPIYYDLEYEPALQTLGYDNYRKMTYNFCDTIKKSGYRAGVYASASDYTSYFSPTDFYNRGYSVWNAHWAKSTPVTCDIWQYSETGSVNGVPTDVDMNYVYNLNIVQ